MRTSTAKIYKTAINTTIYRLPHIVGILRQKYPEKMACDGVKIPFCKDGQVLVHGLSQDYTWDYSVRPSQKVFVQTDEYERDNFIFVQAMQIKGFERAKYVRICAAMIDLDGHEYKMPIKIFEKHVSSLYGGWLVGQFVFTKYYGYYRLDCVKNLWDEAHKL